MRSYSSSSIKARLNALKSRHLFTSKNIRTENNRTNPDVFTVKEMKRQRLTLKGQIAECALP